MAQRLIRRAHAVRPIRVGTAEILHVHLRYAVAAFDLPTLRGYEAIAARAAAPCPSFSQASRNVISQVRMARS
jgi:hypothetical protein